MGFFEVTKLTLFWATLLVGIMSHVATSAVYKVGDSAGWTTIGNIDYKQWAATKSFQIGDVILFEYNPQFHNVMQVNHTEYRTCAPTTPIATYTTGNDSITIATPGHHFFMCGVPGHCQSGQKVDINVLRTPLSPPPNVVSPPPSATAPAPNAAAPMYALGGLFVKIGMCVVMYVIFVMGF